MFAYVGSFTSARRNARGDGIHVYRADAATGAWTHVQHIGELVNPSYLALSPDQRFLYSVHGDGDCATALSLDGETGFAKVLNRGSTGGSNGVRQALDPGARSPSCSPERHEGSRSEVLRPEQLAKAHLPARHHELSVAAIVDGARDLG
jgi:6-phosphogluconolactonase (cycloisomerase 2 family)